MDDYISRKAVLSKCQQIWSNADETTEIGVAIIKIVDELADFVENIPTADVQPVKHGIWLDNPNQSQLYSYICSNCRNSCDWTYRYCPNCGSKNRMDGDKDA